MDPDLSVVTTEEMLNELLSRFEHGGFAGFKELSKDTSCIVRRWKGNAQTIAGLMQDVSLVVLQKQHAESEIGGGTPDDDGLPDADDLEE